VADGNGAGQIIAGVVRTFLRTSGRTGLHLIGGGPGERILAGVWLSGLVNGGEPDPGDQESPEMESWQEEEEKRFRARIAAHEMNGEVAHLANRTYLTLAQRLPPERVLPLGDVRASEVLAMAGPPLLPPPFQSIAGDPVALGELESAIDAWVAGAAIEGPGWRAAGADGVGHSLDETLRRGFLTRAQDRVVPKLGGSTPWIDLDI
jgi:hypothetical protein